MRLVTLEGAPEFPLCYALKDARGRVLAGAGTKVTQPVAARLWELGMRRVFVDDPAFSDLKFDTLISDGTLRRATEIFSEAASQLSKGAGSGLAPGPFRDLAQDVIEDAAAAPLDRAVLLHPATPPAPMAQTLNRAGLAAHLATGLPELLPKRLGIVMAALLCDVKAHLGKGVGGPAAMPVSLIDLREGWPEPTLQCLSQGREEGPGGAGPAICRPAALLAVCDTFSRVRAEKGGRLTPSEAALRHLWNLAGKRLDGRMVRAFLGAVPPFPAGTEVRLSNGFGGVVVRVPVRPKERPAVRVISGPTGERLAEPAECDLGKSKNGHLRVVAVLN